MNCLSLPDPTQGTKTLPSCLFLTVFGAYARSWGRGGVGEVGQMGVEDIRMGMAAVPTMGGNAASRASRKCQAWFHQAFTQHMPGHAGAAAPYFLSQLILSRSVFFLFFCSFASSSFSFLLPTHATLTNYSHLLIHSFSFTVSPSLSPHTHSPSFGHSPSLFTGMRRNEGSYRLPSGYRAEGVPRQG